MRIPTAILVYVLIPLPYAEYVILPDYPQILHSVYLADKKIAIIFFTPCVPTEWFFD